LILYSRVFSPTAAIRAISDPEAAKQEIKRIYEESGESYTHSMADIILATTFGEGWANMKAAGNPQGVKGHIDNAGRLGAGLLDNIVNAPIELLKLSGHVDAVKHGLNFFGDGSFSSRYNETLSAYQNIPRIEVSKAIEEKIEQSGDFTKAAGASVIGAIDNVANLFTPQARQMAAYADAQAGTGASSGGYDPTVAQIKQTATASLDTQESIARVQEDFENFNKTLEEISVKVNSWKK
jgi:hypothetical protein